MTNFERGSATSSPSGRGEATRQKIAQAAVELVAELGWDAVTTRAVAARADVNPALVHYHFGSMEALLRGAVMTAMEAEIGQAARPLMEAPSLAEGLAGSIDAIGAFDTETPTAKLLIEAMVRAMRDPWLTEVMVSSLQDFRALVAERVRAASASGEALAELPPEATAVLLAAALDGLLLHRIIDPTIDIDGVREVLLRMVSDHRAATEAVGPISTTDEPGDRTTPAQGGTP